MTPDSPPSDALAQCRAALEQGRTDLALPRLEQLGAQFPASLAVGQLRGIALRLAQHYPEAEQVFVEALRHHPNAPGLHFGLAQTRYELGHPAAHLFAEAGKHMPGNMELVRNRALAMVSEGDHAGAAALLRDTLDRQPDWLDGHKALATLRWTQGDHEGFADQLATACQARPQSQDLWITWFQLVAQARDWPAATAILDEAQRHLGETPGLLVSRLFVATESGDTASATSLLARTAQIGGDVATLCRIRHLLRQKDPAAAAAIALPMTEGRSGQIYWPYLSLCWRLLGDDRAAWLDRPEALIQPRESDLSTAELAELAEVLRGLHTAQAPYIEQSVRGGTQTDRSVLLRHEPILQRTRAALLDCIRAYVEALPAADPRHPLLSRPRGQLLIEGSWSVRLSRQGYNVPHTHPMGWLSTAFYVSLPGPGQMGAAPAGHIAFGTPPVELGLDLPPYRTITPAPGRLAIFPSTMWHGTVPFDDGERLVIAFDVKPPRH